MKHTIIVWLMVGALCLSFPPVSGAVAQGQNPAGAFDKKTYMHVVKEGDTLWDICQQLYGVPWVWPKLWQLNPHITNPHWIYPGTKLEVYYELPGTPAALSSTAGAARVPPYLPPQPKPLSMEFTEMDQVGFITPSVPPGAGLIAGELREKMMISRTDEVFIQLQEPGQARIGDRYFIFRTSDLIRHPITDKRVGFLNTIRGVLEIIDVAPNYARATVLRSYDLITAGDKLMPYKKRAKEITLKEGIEPKEGNIILAEKYEFLMGQHQIVFIDLGETDDVSSGHRFEVYRQAKAKNYLIRGDSALITRYQPIGELLVLSAEEDTAAALVTKSSIDFNPGAPVRLMVEN